MQLRIDLLRLAYCVLGIGSGWGTLFAIAYCVLRIAYCVLRDTVWTVLRQFRHIRTTIDGTDGLLLVRVNDAG